jgi:hypothetical protein
MQISAKSESELPSSSRPIPDTATSRSKPWTPWILQVSPCFGFRPEVSPEREYAKAAHLLTKYFDSSNNAESVETCSFCIIAQGRRSTRA